MKFRIECVYGDINDYIFYLKDYDLDFDGEIAYVKIDSIEDLFKLKDAVDCDLVIGRAQINIHGPECEPCITIWDD